MRLRLLLAIVFVATQLAGQTQSAACPADQPVDDLLATVHKLHSKRANRNKSLLTDSFCIGGWCLAARDRPKTSPEEIQVTPPSVNPDTDAKTRVQIRQCEDALNDALHAAHNVEVGDQQIEQKNYRGAVSRYSDALDQKPKDAAIEVRYARAAELVGDIDEAKKHYAVAAALSAPKKWVDDAKLGLERLESNSAKH